MNFGALAYQLVKKNDTGKMVSLQNGNYATFPLDQVTSGKRVVDVDMFYDVENYQPMVADVLGQPMFLK
jgi:6-phosphofructokinase 1